MEKGTNGIVIIQLLAQVCLKGGMNYILEMYYTLQMIAYVSKYSFEKPASAQMFIDSVVSIIEFHTLSPEPLI